MAPDIDVILNMTHQAGVPIGTGDEDRANIKFCNYRCPIDGIEDGDLERLICHTASCPGSERLGFKAFVRPPGLTHVRCDPP